MDHYYITGTRRGRGGWIWCRTWWCRCGTST